MRLAVTGGTGLVGRFIVQQALATGDDVCVLTRTAPGPGFFDGPVQHILYDLLGTPPGLDGVDALVHAAFRHVPGRYRGGEGDDADGFLRANLDGSVRLFEAARACGVPRILFLSSRAVYGAYPPGTNLHEDMTPRPDTVYGRMKQEAEQALAAMCGSGLATASLRATGVYGPAGPGQAHKWQRLFADFAGGQPISPRVATEVHGDDLAAAVRVLVSCPVAELAAGLFNVSDIVLDRRDLLAEVSRIARVETMLPERANHALVSEMSTARLRALGWRPGGMERLRAGLPAMLAQAGVSLRTL